MDRLVRVASWLCGSALALMVVFGLVGTWAHMDAGTVHFDPPEHRIEVPLDLDQALDLELVLKNDTGRTVNLLGAPAFCGPDGCAELKGFPQVVQPGARARIVVHFLGGGPGPFAHEIPVYTDHPSQPEVPLRFSGEVRDKPGLPGPETEPGSKTPEPSVVEKWPLSSGKVNESRGRS